MEIISVLTKNGHKEVELEGDNDICYNCECHSEDCIPTMDSAVNFCSHCAESHYCLECGLPLGGDIMYHKECMPADVEIDESLLSNNQFNNKTMQEFINEYLTKIETAIQEQFREDLLLEFEGYFRRALETHEIPEDIEIRFTLQNELGIYHTSPQILEDNHEESNLWDSFENEIQLSQFHDNPILYSLMMDFIYKNGEFEWGANDFSNN